MVVDGLALRLKDDIRHAFEINVLGSFRVTRTGLLPMVRARWGRIVFVSSVVAHFGSPGQGAYAASKSALVGLARSTAREVASLNITVNIAVPGPIDTAMLAAIPAAQREFLKAAAPAGRIGRPEEAAAAVAAFTSENSGYITGAVLGVDGLGMGH